MGKGCLFGCVAPLVVGVVGISLAGTFGGTLLGPTMERWRKGNPTADFAFGALESFRGPPEASAPGELNRGGAGDSTGAARRKRLPGVNDKAALPRDLPVYPTPLDEVYSVGEGHVTAFQRIPGPRESVVEEFRRAMGKSGWRETSDVPGEGVRVLIWEKAGRRCKVEFVERGTVTEMWLASRTPHSN